MNGNHFLVVHNKFGTGTVCKSVIGLAKTICNSPKHFGTCIRMGQKTVFVILVFWIKNTHDGPLQIMIDVDSSDNSRWQLKCQRILKFAKKKLWYFSTKADGSGNIHKFQKNLERIFNFLYAIWESLSFAKKTGSFDLNLILSIQVGILFIWKIKIYLIFVSTRNQFLEISLSSGQLFLFELKSIKKHI